MRDKNKTLQFDLNNEIKLILNKRLVKFSARNEQWEMTFGSDTTEYAQIVYLISKKELTSLQNLSAFLYFTKLIVSNVSFCNKYNKILTEFLAETEKEKPVDEKEDKKTLAEEKAIHEQTPEAIQELENIKENEQ